MAEENQRIKRSKNRNRKASKFMVGSALTVTAIVIAVPIVIFTTPILLGALVLGAAGLAFTIGLSVINKKKELQKIKLDLKKKKGKNLKKSKENSAKKIVEDEITIAASDLSLDASERIKPSFEALENKDSPLTNFFEALISEKEQKENKFFGENLADVDDPGKSEIKEIINPSGQKKNENYTENKENTNLDVSERMMSEFVEIEKMNSSGAIIFEDLLLGEVQEKDKFFGQNLADVDGPEKSEIINPSGQKKKENYTENKKNTDLDSSERIIPSFEALENKDSPLTNFFEAHILENEQKENKFFGENLADVDDPEKSERQEIFNPAEYKKISNDVDSPEKSKIKEIVNPSEQKKSENYIKNKEDTNLDISERMMSDFMEMEKINSSGGIIFEDSLLGEVQEKDKFFGENFADVDAPEKSERQEIFNPAEYKKKDSPTKNNENANSQTTKEFIENKMIHAQKPKFAINRDFDSNRRSEKQNKTKKHDQHRSKKLKNEKHQKIAFSSTSPSLDAFLIAKNAERKSNTSGERKTAPSKKQSSRKGKKYNGLRNG